LLALREITVLGQDFGSVDLEDVDDTGMVVDNVDISSMSRGLGRVLCRGSLSESAKAAKFSASTECCKFPGLPVPVIGLRARSCFPGMELDRAVLSWIPAYLDIISNEPRCHVDFSLWGVAGVPPSVTRLEGVLQGDDGQL